MLKQGILNSDICGKSGLCGRYSTISILFREVVFVEVAEVVVFSNSIDHCTVHDHPIWLQTALIPCDRVDKKQFLVFELVVRERQHIGQWTNVPTSLTHAHHHHPSSSSSP